MSVFDNAGADTPAEEQARGLILAIDQSAMTVTLAEEYLSPFGAISGSQGSVQLQNNTNVVVGWGAEPYYTEYSQDGTIIYDVHFSGNDSSGTQNYRCWKDDWVGSPTDAPAVVLSDGTVFVSWLGMSKLLLL